VRCQWSRHRLSASHGASGISQSDARRCRGLQPTLLLQRDQAPGIIRINTRGPSHGQTTLTPGGRSWSLKHGKGQRGRHISETRMSEIRAHSSRDSGLPASRDGPSLALAGLGTTQTGRRIRKREKSTVASPSTSQRDTRDSPIPVRVSMDTSASILRMALTSGTGSPPLALCLSAWRRGAPRLELHLEQQQACDGSPRNLACARGSGRLLADQVLALGQIRCFAEGSDVRCGECLE
jgi:hypothetical protein